MHGGSGINVVPSSCEAYGDVRLLPGISPEEIRGLITEQLERFSNSNYQPDDLLEVPAAAVAAVEAITGIHPRVEGSGLACDGWVFITRGIPTVCRYGIAQGGVHV